MGGRVGNRLDCQLLRMEWRQAAEAGGDVSAKRCRLPVSLKKRLAAQNEMKIEISSHPK